MNHDPLQTSSAPSAGHSTDQDQPDQGDLIDVTALATRLGVTPRFVRRLIAERRVPFLKIGKFIRFDPLEIDGWVDVCRVPVK